jgi:hypothetical protein
MIVHCADCDQEFETWGAGEVEIWLHMVTEHPREKKTA